jgi:hypothetical protein
MISPGSDDRSEIIDFFSYGSWAPHGPHVAAMKVAAQVARYIEIHNKNYKKDWSRRAQGVIASSFVSLANLPGGKYPIFDKSLLMTQESSKPGNRSSLGALEWPELKGLRPAEKDEVALELVVQAALAILAKAEGIFAFGQSILSTNRPPRKVDKDCWWAVKRYLEGMTGHLSKTGKLSQSVVVSEVNQSDVWVVAGLRPELVETGYLRAYQVHAIGRACLGASSDVTVAVKAAFCVASGWNKEQIQTLPRDPYAFRYEDAAGICQEAFLVSFKNRAGHFVNALFERGLKFLKLTKDQNIAFWEETDREINEAAHLLVLGDASIMDMMDRYQVLTDAIRGFDLFGDFSDSFFVCLGQEELTGAEYNIKLYGLDSYLGRAGVTYRSIRQSYVNVTRRATGSLASARHLTNNADVGVILTHYDDPVIQAELDEGVAFWQNCIQARVVESEPSLSIHLAIPEVELEWFRNLSVAAGISASLQISSRNVNLSEPEILEVVPTPEFFQELYLIGLSIFAARSRIGNDRWRVQAIPILAYVKALKRHIRESGLVDRYAGAVRIAMRKLRAGEIVPPAVLIS